LKILILSFYFRPDLCAGSFRATALVNELRTALPERSQIDVVTTLPNRYKSFSVEAPQSEYQDNVSVYRIPIPSHKSGILDQSLTFLFYFWRTVRYVKTRDYDLVLATSSRLMTAALGSWIARRKNVALYLDIRDVFVDTITDVLPKCVGSVLKPGLSLLESWTIGKAVRVNLVSEGFADYFRKRYPKIRYSFFTNGIDDEFLAVGLMTNHRKKETGSVVRVVCAGNIGEGQGLHGIIPKLARRMKDRVCFRIIGDGGRKALLRDALERAEVDNVELIDPMPRDQLIRAYLDADVLFLHLNGYRAFEKVLPSKIFEYGALGKPIWAGLRGYSAKFVKSEIKNVAVFTPCDVEAAEKVFDNLVLQNIPRPEFIDKFSRANIMKRMVQDILSLMNDSERK